MMSFAIKEGIYFKDRADVYNRREPEDPMILRVEAEDLLKNSSRLHSLYTAFKMQALSRKKCYWFLESLEGLVINSDTIFIITS